MATAAAARIRLHDLAVARGERIVARGVSFDLHAGEITALVGPSGAGKTTLLRSVVRLDEPAGGRVLVDGVDAATLDPRLLRRRVALVMQSPVMLPGTVRDNLAYGLGTADDRVFDAALESTGLAPGFLDRQASAVSGGEAARVAIARALTRAPAALLLDEPTAALDAVSAAAIERLLQDLAARGLALLLVTHDEALAARVAHRAARLAGGELVAAGPAAQVLAR
jgi:ABC-type cobalamin/Fe3+-siderophores transport system ATPase subunit